MLPVLDEDEEIDEGESELFMQQHITSAAMKARMTLMSKMELGLCMENVHAQDAYLHGKISRKYMHVLIVKGNCSLDDMATTQEVFHKAPESAAAIRRRLRAERKAEEQQKEAALQPKSSREILEEFLLGDKSRYVCTHRIVSGLSTLLCSLMVLTPIPEQIQGRKVEKKKRTRLYPPSNPYSLVTVAADIRTALTSMVGNVYSHI